jgi:hypothetical protein
MQMGAEENSTASDIGNGQSSGGKPERHQVTEGQVTRRLIRTQVGTIG